jgi:hypothetical protein
MNSNIINLGTLLHAPENDIADDYPVKLMDNDKRKGEGPVIDLSSKSHFPPGIRVGNVFNLRNTREVFFLHPS